MGGKKDKHRRMDDGRKKETNKQKNKERKMGGWLDGRKEGRNGGGKEAGRGMDGWMKVRKKERLGSSGQLKYKCHLVGESRMSVVPSSGRI